MRTVLALLLAGWGLLAAGRAVAGVIDPWLDVIVHADQPVSLFCTPAGSGVAFADADGFGGYTVDATLVVVLYSDQPGWGEPIPGFPAEDMWLQSAFSGLAPCQSGTIPEADTGPDGSTTWSLPLRTGGCVDPGAGDRIVIIVNGAPINGVPDLQMGINSADLDGNGVVNLTDVGVFASDLHGAYAYRSDFVWDGIINISDVGRMAAAVGSACP